MEAELTQSDQAEQTFNENLCVNCQVNHFEPGHAVNLCSSCRETLIKYPIPKSIRYFAVGLFAVIVISLVRTSTYISAAIHLGKAEKAIEKKLFVTAQREIALVLEQFPNDLITNSNMIIASSYNFDIANAGAAFDKVANKVMEDEDLLNQANKAMAYIDKFISPDTVTTKKIAAASHSSAELMKMYHSIHSLPTPASGNNVLKVNVANYLYDLNDYEHTKSILMDVLKNDPDFYPALSLMSAIKRNEGHYDEALACCDKMLYNNREDVGAISQKVRIELKRKHDKQAAILASEAIKINGQNDSALEAKAMVDYFAGRKKESLAILDVIKGHESYSGDSTISTRLSGILNGSVIYR
jgi:tetratricopeptide (TPR) repeat protein